MLSLGAAGATGCRWSSSAVRHVRHLGSPCFTSATCALHSFSRATIEVGSTLPVVYRLLLYRRSSFESVWPAASSAATSSSLPGTASAALASLMVVMSSQLDG